MHGSYVIIDLDGLIVETSKIYPQQFTLIGIAGSQYEFVRYTGLDNDGTKLKVKILSRTNNECLVSIKVNDSELNSEIYQYVITIVEGSDRPNAKPVGYSIDTTILEQQR